MINAVGALEVRAIRDSFKAGFATWDDCTDRRDQKGAKAARRQMQAAALALLPTQVANRPGWYVFSDLGQPKGLQGIHYVGIAKTGNRTIGRRIVDRFKDDSCFDVSLDFMTEAEQRKIVLQRLTTALPETGTNYVDKHMDVAKLIRKSTHILMIGTDDAVSIIEEVERLLIAGAVRVEAPLTNVVHRSFRGTVSIEARTRAFEVLAQLGSMGLSPDTIDAWKAGIETL